MKNKKKITVVTGGAGFIGSHMVDLLLAKKYKVNVIDNLSGGHKKNLIRHKNNPNLKFEKKDICKLKNNHKFFKSADFVFHFAGIGDIVPSIKNPLNYMQTNIQGTVRVLEAARHNRIKKFVYSASASCYGLNSSRTNEKGKIDTKYPYALSKYMGEQTAFHWHKVYGLPVNSIRIFNAYGTRVRTTGAYGAVFGVFFRAESLNVAVSINQSLFGFHTSPDADFNNIKISEDRLWFLILIVWFAPNMKEIMSKYFESENFGVTQHHSVIGRRWYHWYPNTRWAAFTSILFILSLLELTQSERFIYFQF